MSPVAAEPYIFPSPLRPRWEQIDPNGHLPPAGSGQWFFDAVEQQATTLRYRVWFVAQRNISREKARKEGEVVPYTVFGTLNVEAERQYGSASALKAIRLAVGEHLRDAYPATQYEEPIISHIRRLNPDLQVVLTWLGALYEREQLKAQAAINTLPVDTSINLSVNAQFARAREAREHMVIVEKAIDALAQRFPDVPATMIVIRGQNLIRRARGLEALHV